MTYQPLDSKDEELRLQRMVARNLIQGMRIGDFIRFPNGHVERFSHDWGDGLQTSLGGNTYLNASGYASFTNGSLNPAVPRDLITLTDETRDGEFWFFHHNYSGPGRGVHFTIPCRVFETTAPYTGYDAKRLQEQETAKRQQLQTTDFLKAVA